jgi:hypothetical protein
MFTTVLNNFFQRWAGTPYMSGQQSCQQGVDCIRYVTALYDNLCPGEKAPLRTLPPDGSFHNRSGAIKAMLQVKRRYPKCKIIRDKQVEPGDMLIIGPIGGGPGHAMLVGTEPNTLWHCTPRNGVHKTGWALPVSHFKLFRVYRMKNRVQTWKIF